MRLPHQVGAAVLVAAMLLCLPVNHVSARVHSQGTSTEDRDRGKELYRKKHIPEAIEALRKAVKANKRDSEAWYYLGLAQIENIDAKNATKSFQAAIDLEPRFALAREGLAYALLLRNKSADAILQAQAALEVDSNLPDAHYVIGMARLRTGAWQQALEQAEVVIGSNPQLASAYLLKSQALVRFLGDIPVLGEGAAPRTAHFEEAAAALEQYLRLNPNSDDRQTWVEQLESLRFFAANLQGSNSDKVALGRNVTTKARVLSKQEPQYTTSARFNGIIGTVVLRVVFAADGTVQHILVLRDLPYGLTEMAIKAARKIKFEPAVKDGHPVSMFMQLEYNFNLF